MIEKTADVADGILVFLFACLICNPVLSHASPDYAGIAQDTYLVLYFLDFGLIICLKETGDCHFPYFHCILIGDSEEILDNRVIYLPKTDI